MAIICQEPESRNKGFQCVKKMASGVDSYDKKRKCKECREEEKRDSALYDAATHPK